MAPSMGTAALWVSRDSRQPGSRASVHPVSFLSITARQLGPHFVLNQESRMPLNGAFWSSIPTLPCMVILILTIIIPLYPGLSLGAAANPLGKKETRFWSPGLSLGPELAVGSASQADFRGRALHPPAGHRPFHTSPLPWPCQERTCSLFMAGGRKGRGHAANRPTMSARVPLWQTRCFYPHTPHSASPPHQHARPSTIQRVKWRMTLSSGGGSLRSGYSWQPQSRDTGSSGWETLSSEDPDSYRGTRSIPSP